MHRDIDAAVRGIRQVLRGSIGKRVKERRRRHFRALQILDLLLHGAGQLAPLSQRQSYGLFHGQQVENHRLWVIALHAVHQRQRI